MKNNIYKYQFKLNLDNEIEKKAYEKFVNIDKTTYANQKAFLIRLILGAEDFVKSVEELRECQQNEIDVDTSKVSLKDYEEIKKLLNEILTVVINDKLDIIKELHNILPNNTVEAPCDGNNTISEKEEFIEFNMDFLNYYDEDD